VKFASDWLTDAYSFPSRCRSKNQSPVQKFYHSMYSDSVERIFKFSNGSEPVLAMQLWNDWNTQVLRWEQSHANDADFDYMVVRSEDMLNPETKFEMLARPAAFVGSTMSVQELCNMSRTDAVDLGQSKSWGIYDDKLHLGTSSDTESGSEAKVHERYGKWKHALQDLPELSAELHDEGAQGLAVFGYEPRANALTLGSQTGIILRNEGLECR